MPNIGNVFTSNDYGDFEIISEPFVKPKII